MSITRTSLALFALALLSASVVADDEPYRVKDLKITILSTMMTQVGVGEWGFSALVEADGHRILFDTGMRPDTVLLNARSMRINLSDVEEVVLSHNHGDLYICRLQIAMDDALFMRRLQGLRNLREHRRQSPR